MAELHRQVPDLRRRQAALVFSAQMCGVICCDEAGKPLRRCIIWVDKRSAATTAKLTGGFPKLFGYNAFKLATWVRLANGAPSHNGMDPPGKMLWIRDNEPEIWDKTHKLLDVKDWLVHRATGRFVTTYDCANLTWMLDTRPKVMNWSDRLISMVGIPRTMLPELANGSDVAGLLGGNAAEDLGLDAGTPVCCGCGDVTATALGSDALKDGELHLHMGTSSWVGGFFPGRRLAVSEGYATIASAAEGRPLLIATQESAGACFDWMVRLMTNGRGPSDEVNAEFIDAALTDGERDATPVFLPWLAGERAPVDDHRLRGALLGLSLTDDRSTLVRAVAEGIAINTRWAFASVSQQPGVLAASPVKLLGGAAASASLSRILADCLGRDLAVPEHPQLAGIRGAARLAAFGLGWIASPWDMMEKHPDGMLVRHDPARRAYFDRRYRLFLDAYKSTAPWFRRAFQEFQL
jgi:xylulokinase